MTAAIGVGVLLNQCFDRVDQAIDGAKNAGLRLEIEAGAQLRQTIENAKIAYADSINLTMDRIDATARNTIDQLKTLVDGFEQRNAKILTNLAASAQQVANTLPFHNERPQLTSVLPRYLIRTSQTPIVFKFLGNFEHAPQATYAPTLKFSGQKFNASHVTTQQLEFSVPPASVFPGSVLQSAQKIIFSEGVLKTFWPKTFGKNVAKFRVMIGALPASPGSIKLEYNTDRIKKVVRERKTNNQHLDSCRESGNDDHKGHLFMGSPSEGWHVVKGSSHHTVTHHGECELPSFVSDDGDRVVYKGSTIHKVAGSSGSMDVVIIFNEYQEVKVVDHHEETINLKWGDSRAFNQPLGRWKVKFNAFEGSSNEFVGSDTTSSPYLKIENQGGGFVIKATRPRDLEDI